MIFRGNGGHRSLKRFWTCPPILAGLFGTRPVHIDFWQETPLQSANSDVLSTGSRTMARGLMSGRVLVGVLTACVAVGLTAVVLSTTSHGPVEMISFSNAWGSWCVPHRHPRSPASADPLSGLMRRTLRRRPPTRLHSRAAGCIRWMTR